MISTRGNNNTLVVDRTCVPVWDLCYAISNYKNPAELKQRFQVNTEEIFACIDAFSDMNGPTENDFVTFTWEEIDGDVDLNTTKISDWVYLTVINYGRTLEANTEVFNDLYTRGLEAVFTDCLNDIIDGNRNFEDASDVHRIVFTSFEKEYGHVDAEKANKLLVSWNNE